MKLMSPLFTLRSPTLAAVALAIATIASAGTRAAVMPSDADIIPVPTIPFLTLAPSATSPAVHEAYAALQAERLDEAVTAARHAVAGATTVPERAAANEVLGLALFLAGKRDDALDALRTAVALDPGRRSSRTNLGSVALELGLLGEAGPLLEAAAADPADHVAQERLGALRALTGNRTGAIAAYEKALSGASSDQLPMRVVLAVLLLQDRRPSAAAAVLTQAVDPARASGQALLTLAGAWLALGKATDARGLLLAASARAAAAPAAAAAGSRPPPDAGLLFLLSRSQRETGDRAGAIESLRQAVAARPSWALAFDHLGVALAEGGDWTGARAALDRSLALQPDDATMAAQLAGVMALGDKPTRPLAPLEALSQRDDARPADVIMLMRAQMAAGLMTEAERSGGAGVQRFPRDASLRVHLAVLVASQGHSEDALAIIDTALVTMPDDAALLRGAALTQARLNRPADAVTTARRLVALDPRDVNARFLLAALMQDAGDRANARQIYRDILLGAPDHVPSLNNLSALLTAEGAASEAVPLARRAATLAPNSASVQDTLGWALLQAGQPGEAAEALGRAEALEPTNPTIAFRAAQAQRAAGNVAAARRSVARALGLGQPFQKKNEARALHAELVH
jgi:Flp pilus assembly protein TadD